ncbi:1-acyl-sn-glycerol-3-phosphate acyltransferase alpha [Caerostris darwini]|uniref:1-acyl-sn-glycerol-3-phosphate acyltransferase n=1 Tax=Caerostris darwini TaxID=1538125 RepID=A0AAV4SU41_9ARAC|nr:1-acyl-sn-glycerol-3-phosphate acyltransferase alpha [Caerostris darwini]
MCQPGNPENLLYSSWFVHHVISRIFRLKWEVKNKELLNPKEPCVFVCNHQSALDISGMMYIWPLFHPCVPVLKRELLFSGPFGIFCWLAGCIFVDRFNSEKARDTLNMKVKVLKERNVKLWIFPEGTRNDQGTLLPFKKGAFHIATQMKIPIVPVVFSEYTDFYNIREKIFDQGTITVTILPLVKTDNLTPKDVPLLTEEVRSIMMSSLKQSAEEMSQTKSNGNVGVKEQSQ